MHRCQGAWSRLFAGALAWSSVAGCGRTEFDPIHNVAFVTSTTHQLITFGADLAGADAICAERAADAGLVGPFAAYLASSTVRAPDRLANARGWLRTDGRPFVDRIVDLTAGRLYHPLRVDEHGEDLGIAAGPVATGAQADGTVSAFSTCLDYTSPMTYEGVRVGYAQRTFQGWSEEGRVPCSNGVRLYCFGTSFDLPLEPPELTGRRAFVTVQALSVGGGLAAADALCQSEAALAGLGGTFLALLPTGASSAASRFDLTGPAWSRVDGIVLAESALAFMAGSLLASPNVTAIGDHVGSLVLTGGAPSQPGRTCNDWTDPATNTDHGNSATTSGAAFVASGGGCGGPIYCLEP